MLLLQASINGDAENSFVHVLWRRMGRGDLAIDTRYWIGLTKQTGQLQWTDSSQSLYANWETGVEENRECVNLLTYRLNIHVFIFI